MTRRSSSPKIFRDFSSATAPQADSAGSGGETVLWIDATIPAADDKRLAQFQEIDDGVGQRLWPLGSHRVPGVVHQHVVAVGHAFPVRTAHPRRHHLVRSA